MLYLGGKFLLRKHIIKILSEFRSDGQYWVEPFVGGAWVIEKAGGRRIGGDINEYAVALYQAIQRGWDPNIKIDREYYHLVKDNKAAFPRHIVGLVGFCASYGGKFFGGYGGISKGNKFPKHVYSINGLIKQKKGLMGVEFRHCSYQDLNVPADSLIYCDPPYKGTTGYGHKFNHDEFYQWCRQKSRDGHKVFISEYNMPKPFKCIWSKEHKTLVSKQKKAPKRVEKLFTI